MEAVVRAEPSELSSEELSRSGMLSDFVEIGESVIFQKIGEEVVLLDITTQEYFFLDNVGADVWQLLMAHQCVSAVASRLTEMYSIDEKTALSDINPLIAQLLAAKLLKPASQPES